jgi:hypothetical protein
MEDRVPIHRLLLTTLLILVTGACDIRAHAQQPMAKLPADVEDLLWWLPPDTETLQVTRRPPKPQGPLSGALAQTFGDIGFGAAYAARLTQHLGARITLSVNGSRHFLPPSSLGDTRYEGAQIFVFDKPLGASMSRSLKGLETSAVSVEQIEGLKVVEFHDEMEDDTWTSYVTIPRPDVLVVATDRAYLGELLRRRGARAEPRAFASELPEWEWVDTGAPFWALRHYRRTADTSAAPLDPRSAGLDATAAGVAAYAKPDGRPILTHYLSRAANADEIVRRLLHHPGDGVAPIDRRVSSDAIEVLFSAKDEEHLSMFFFYLMSTFGHRIYL